MEDNSVFDKYEKKSAEVKSEPLIFHEGGKTGKIHRAVCSVTQQEALRMSDEQVRIEMLKKVKEDIANMGYTYDKEPVLFKKGGRWVMTTFIRKSMFWQSSKETAKNKFPAPSIEDIFGRKN